MTEVEFRHRDHWTRHGTEKVGYESKRAAKRAARFLRGEPNAYRCSQCSGWHVGNRPEEVDW